MIIAVDFDGTIVKHRYPRIGEELPFAIDTLKQLIEDRHLLILWSVREGALLDEAVEWCREKGVEFYAVNRDFPEENGSEKHYSRKIKADLFIDDRGIGGIPEWTEIYKMIKSGKHLQPCSAPTDRKTSRYKKSRFVKNILRSALPFSE
ncbi:MAG: hypothetical protein R3Y04_05850 [Rikenellaceae bacterium]